MINKYTCEAYKLISIYIIVNKKNINNPMSHD